MSGHKPHRLILYLVIISLMFSNNLANAQDVLFGTIDSTRLPIIKSHYQKELLIDYCLEPEKWDTVKHGLNVSVVSTNEIFFRTEVPNLKRASQKFEASAWKGERINLELLVWSPDTLKQINIELNELKSSANTRISKKNCKAYLVRYVISNFPYNSDQYVCGVGPTNSGYLMPDRFEEFERFELPGRTVRPIWVSIDIPRTLKADLYKSIITITSDKESLEIPIEIRVLDLALPSPQKWNYRLDLWQNPWVIADYFNVKPWSEVFKILLRKHLKLYADAGGKYITTYAVHSPWADNSYYLEKSMINWIKQKDGNWKFDYSIFDEYIELAHSVGISGAITIYTLIPWGDRFIYYDEETKNYVTDHWPVNSETYEKNINTFLTDLRKHLKVKGWYNKTFLGINENELQQTLNVIELIKKNSNDWKISYAGYWHEELSGLVDDYSCQIAFEPSVEEIQNRVKDNQFTTTYVCCIPAKPNNFLHSPPIEGRWLSWYIEAKGYSGFLRWAYDAWPSDPTRDARHIFWPAGDAFLVYPGGNSCIRFEKMGEGIVDFEKIKIIRSKIKKSNDQTIKKLWAEFEINQQKILDEKKYNSADLENMVNEGVRIINELAIRLK